MLLGTVQGTVTENGAPVAGLAATLSDAGGQTLSTTTNDSGMYGFASLPAGNYRLSLTLPKHTVTEAANGATSADGEAGGSVARWANRASSRASLRAWSRG